MGFCFFANAVVAARHARRRMARRASRSSISTSTTAMAARPASRRTPAILYASSHQWPCYPGTGEAREKGVGNIFNAPLSPGADGAAFRAAWAETLLPAIEAFAPELLVISAGFDAHARDPLAQLRVREADFAWLTAELCAHRRAAWRGPCRVSLLEGGYDLEALAHSTAAHVRVLMRA